MQARYTFLAAALVAVVAAQVPDLSSLPACAQSCILQSIGVSGCDIQDPEVAKCTCASKPYNDAVAACLTAPGGCTEVEVGQAQAFANTVCGTGSSTNGTESATSTATPSSGTESSSTAVPSTSGASESVSSAISSVSSSASAAASGASSSASAAVSSITAGGAAPTNAAVVGLMGVLGLAAAAL